MKIMQHAKSGFFNSLKISTNYEIAKNGTTIAMFKVVANCDWFLEMTIWHLNTVFSRSQIVILKRKVKWKI